VTSDTEDHIDDTPMPLLDHLIELRRRLIWSIVAFLLTFVVSYHFAGQIYNFLAEPLVHAMQARGEQAHMIYTALLEAFITQIKVALFTAAFFSFPIVATQIWLFVAPGLYRSEKRVVMPFLIATPILFLMGAALAYYIVFPMAWKFFLSFQSMGPQAPGGLQVSLEAKISEYLSLVMKLIFAFGVAFELPVVLTLLAKVGIIDASDLRRVRRFAYVGMFGLAALITPPDAISMISLALPLVVLYEVSVISAAMFGAKEG
jgi:sec-independent protein translocase protein TatC